MVSACLGDHPYIDYPEPPFTVWACSVDYKQMRDSVMTSLEGDSTHPRMLPLGVRLNENKMTYYLPNGSKIVLKSADSGRKAFQGAGLPLIWLDEELPEDILKELFVRIGPGYKTRVIWTMTAVTGLSYAYDYFYVPFMAAKDEGREHPRIHYSEASMYEAPHLTDDQIESIIEKFPEGSKELEVRIKGGFRDLTGDSIFSTDCIEYHRKHVCKPEKQIYLTRMDDKVVAHEWDYNLTGEEVPWHVDIWKPPILGHRYCLGCDVAEGKLTDANNEDSPRDWSTIVVLDRETKEVVAVVRTRIDPTTLGKVLWMLGKYYNYGWVVPEINSMGIAVLGVLTGKADFPVYGRIYQRRKDYDEWAEDIVADDLGFRTVTMTRGKLVTDLKDAVEPSKVNGLVTCKIYDEKIITEFKSFQRTKLGKPEAVRGRHDDLVFGFGLAVQGDISCPTNEAPIQSTTGRKSGGGGRNLQIVGAMGGDVYIPGEKRN